ncbi:MAG: STAS domain-containing protein [Betaproteobacteria bacterium]
MPGAPVKNPDLLKEVLEFLSDPSTDWAVPNDTIRGAPSGGAERSELQAMIARKRHNDAVRLAELNLLRRIRQEGLTGDQIREMERAQALAASSRGSDLKHGSTHSESNADAPGAIRRSKLHSDDAVTQLLPPRNKGRADDAGNVGPMAATPESRGTGAARQTGSGASAREKDHAGAMPHEREQGGAGELEEVNHDDELDQAAIAFANADFGGCESTLRELVGPGGRRRRHVPTWRALLDLYRATGQQSDFERLAVAYTRDLGQTPPQWVSIPRMAMNIAEQPPRPGADPAGKSRAGALDAPTWQCPMLLDATAVSSMRAFTQREQAAKVIDWTTVKVLTHEGAQRLLECLQACADTPERLVWKGTTALLDLLRDTPRAEGRPEDEVLWQVRLAVVRLMGVQGPYDLMALDFEAAYGKTAPAWSPAAAKIVLAEHRQPPNLATGADFSVSTLYDRLRGPSETTVELVGQLTGDINDTLARMLAAIQGSRSVKVSCLRLIRVDLMAAGELLNWMGARHAEGRMVRFVEVHRLLALFFCAMGLDDHATIELRSL